MTAEQQEIIRGMSGVELQDCAERGVDLPAEARERLRQWHDRGPWAAYDAIADRASRPRYTSPARGDKPKPTLPVAGYHKR